MVVDVLVVDVVVGSVVEVDVVDVVVGSVVDVDEVVVVVGSVVDVDEVVVDEVTAIPVTVSVAVPPPGSVAVTVNDWVPDWAHVSENVRMPPSAGWKV
jgi:hypothetical protein